ncbi:ABC transporter ATP-binding protein [Photobacterium sp. ZSDE20]|uniref:ABC transporter ATP-binding protein n=1 Tax=Photobacterium pectinilyticum TaxID=2906793 RepID=A0ABT1N4D7_9GAMM|nr:ABC transporter ATP-binding protein [Photobacterium sp. ZSDE20]MCQ1059610.1 ABC transporter ATP-binding protein [Photobacterium sp. ZSDE20]MDD1828955.1 ABC transporter ATP-binding protein [Photobacterium sp. ZSDE20]
MSNQLHTHSQVFLSCSNVSRSIGQQTILKDVSFTLEEGQVYCIVGPSGSGKSSLLKIVAGIDAPDNGSVTLQNTLITQGPKMLPPELRRMNMVFQDYALWPHMKVRDIIGYGLNKIGREARTRRVDEMLSLLQITQYADRYPRELSGGQAQRVSIARAIATNPDVLLFDEPLSNLDIQLRAEMRGEFSKLFKKLNKTVLYVTHDPLEACAFADKIIVMKDGEIEQIDSPQTLFSAPNSPWIASLAGFDCKLPVENVLIDPGTNTASVSFHGRTLHAKPSAHADELSKHIWLRSAGLGFTANNEQLENCIPGRVLKSSFEGSHWRIDLDIGAEVAIPIQHPESIEIDSTVNIHMPYDHCLLINE